MLDLFEIRPAGRFHPIIYRLTLGTFALARHWDSEDLPAVERGRAFEEALYRFCDRRLLPLSERAGSRTLRYARSASGMRHENDGVVAAPDLTVHLEAKHLRSEVSKNDLMVFNQKGLDYLLGGAMQLRRRPFYRLFLSGSSLSHEARRFAALWGIVAVEPDRLPLPLLHWLVGSSLAPGLADRGMANRIWQEVPRVVMPLQERLLSLPLCLGDHTDALNPYRLDMLLQRMQMQEGDTYWSLLDQHDPLWLERVYEEIMARSAERTRPLFPRGTARPSRMVTRRGVGTGNPEAASQ